MDTAKQALISSRILALVADGATLRAAFDAVLGVGRYEHLASDVYDALRAKAESGR